jgi:hypothetical protein
MNHRVPKYQRIFFSSDMKHLSTGQEMYCITQLATLSISCLVCYAHICIHTYTHTYPNRFNLKERTFHNIKHFSICERSFSGVILNFSNIIAAVEGTRGSLPTGRVKCCLYVYLRSERGETQTAQVPWRLHLERTIAKGLGTHTTRLIRYSEDGVKLQAGSPQCPHRLWGQPNLLYSGYRGHFPRRQSGRGVRLTTNLHLVPSSRISVPYLHFPLRLHGLVLNYLNSGTTLILSCL